MVAFNTAHLANLPHGKLYPGMSSGAQKISTDPI